jgi:hypothetical protein
MAPHLPRPAALRLVRAREAAGKPPRPPLGLCSWSEDARDLAVMALLPKPWPGSGGDVDAVARQLPAPGELAPGSLVVVLGEGDADARGGVVARWLGPRPRLSRAVRGSALLARGYVRLGADADEASGHDLVWGYARS